MTEQIALDPYAFMLPFYDAWSAHMKGDIEFYARRARESATPVVELGAGNGRVTIPMAAEGARVIAVDVSDAMLTALARNAAEAGVADRVTAIKDDMRSFVADPPVDLVVIPFRSFLHNLTTDDQMRTLDAIGRSLRPGGRLILNFFTPDPLRIAELNGRSRLQAEMIDEFGRRCEIWATSTSTLATQGLELTAEQRVFEGERLAATASTTLRLRMVYRYEFDHLLARTGFEVEALHGDFDEKPYGPGPDEMIWIARKP